MPEQIEFKSSGNLPNLMYVMSVMSIYSSVADLKLLTYSSF